jgi:hypothetical protein
MHQMTAPCVLLRPEHLLAGQDTEEEDSDVEDPDLCRPDLMCTLWLSF